MNVMLVLMLKLLYYRVDFHFGGEILGNAGPVIQLYSCQRRLLKAATDRINYQCFSQVPAVDQTAFWSLSNPPLLSVIISFFVSEDEQSLQICLITW